uniref:Uncharacterized protein n=1 Tax=Rhizophora mucronata TaxID=61149 RepID=A0A2P2PW43_RHIMU
MVLWYLAFQNFDLVLAKLVLFHCRYLILFFHP